GDRTLYRAEERGTRRTTADRHSSLLQGRIDFGTPPGLDRRRSDCRGNQEHRPIRSHSHRSDADLPAGDRPARWFAFEFQHCIPETGNQARHALGKVISVPPCLRGPSPATSAPYHLSTRLPRQMGPSSTYSHSGFLVISRSPWCTRSKVVTCSSSHSK